MSKFKPGDRVAIYGPYMKNGGWAGDSASRHTDTVSVNHGTYLQLENGCCHPKQARKLKKKERRVVFVHQSFFDRYPKGTPLVQYSGLTVSTHGDASPGPEWTTFIEGKRK